MEKNRKKIILTFDVEDWFQVENFKNHIKRDSWDKRELRVKENTIKILDILDSFEFKPKATFFVLGWLAKKDPSIVSEIESRGHETASHGYNHELCTNLNEEELLGDLIKSREILEDITGKKVLGYRAPSFAINDRIVEIIRKAGYSYDSSYNNFSMHGRYGEIDLGEKEKKGIAFRVYDGFYELPLSNIDFGNKIIPLGGGGYFRLYPSALFEFGMKKVLKKEDAFLYYSHPWEFDPFQPRVKQAPKSFKFRHYINLRKTEKKFEKMIQTFSDHEFVTIKDYLSQ